MGFFENLGRKVGEFTHEAKRAADEEAPYACENCGERFYAARETCPECGSEAVVERDVPSETGETDEGIERAKTDGDDTADATDGTTVDEGTEADGTAAEPDDSGEVDPLIEEAEDTEDDPADRD